MHSVAALLALLLALGLAAACGGDDDEGEADVVPSSGVPWLLSSGLDVAGWEDAPPSASFTLDTVGGFGGCNRFTAPYTVDGDGIEIGQIASTRMACPPPADAVERAYLAALERVVGWRVEEDGAELALLDDDGAELLRYRAGHARRRLGGDGDPHGDALSSPLPGTEITASFADDGTLTGSAGCNTYSTRFTINQGDIEIGSPKSTRRLAPSRRA